MSRSTAGEGTPARFPAAVAAALEAAGWQPGRWDIKRAEEWADELHAHLSPAGHCHAIFPAAVEAWAEFGGLAIAPGRLPGRGLRAGRAGGGEVAPCGVVVDPLRGRHLARTLGDLGRAVGTELSPLGVETPGDAQLAIDTEGRIYALDHAGDWYLGSSIDDALITLLTGLRPVRLMAAP